MKRAGEFRGVGEPPPRQNTLNNAPDRNFLNSVRQAARDNRLPASPISRLLYGFAFLGYAGLVVIVWVAAAMLVAARYYPREAGPTAQTSNTGKHPFIDPEMQKAIIESLPNASTDETPVVIKIRGQSYRLPRNYRLF